MSDQELDDLFKEASGSQNTSFDASDWQKMQALLDEQSAIRSPFWNWKRYTWVAVLFLSSVGVVELFSVKEEGTAGSAETHLIAQESSAAPLSEKNTVTSELNEKREQIETEEQKKISGVERQEFGSPKKNKQTVIIEGNEKTLQERRKLDAERNSSESVVADTELEEKTPEKSEAIINKSVSSDPELRRGETLNKLIQNETEQKDSLDVQVLSKATVTDSVKEESSREEDKPVEPNRSLSLKIALSPDFSSVGYFTPGRTGFNYGLIAEYAFGKHVSVSLGGIWSKKLYTYKNIESSYGQVVMDGRIIDGDCRILDVPLNVNYYINPGHRFTIYGSLGLSSYFMFSEDYKYDVIRNGSSYDYTTHVERKNNEWFKMTNISLGLQYRVRSQWALQIEPFVKAPLSGIGEGDYKLVSSGVFFNVKYTFK